MASSQDIREAIGLDNARYYDKGFNDGVRLTKSKATLKDRAAEYLETAELIRSKLGSNFSLYEALQLSIQIALSSSIPPKS
jgi:hypothetical protein